MSDQLSALLVSITKKVEKHFLKWAYNGKVEKMSKKGYKSATTSDGKEKNTGPLNFQTYSTYKISRSYHQISNGS